MKNKEILQALETKDKLALQSALVKIEVLDLSRSHDISLLSTDKILLLAKVLKANCTLTRISLRYNEIESIAGHAIAKALKVNCTLTELDLSNNKIETLAALSIAETLKYNFTLKKLNLERNRLGIGGAEFIMKALEGNSILAILNLGENEIKDLSTTRVTQALKVNKTLTHLSLKGNQIGDLGAKTVAKFLELNSCLRQLDLGDNQIKDEGCIAIAEALKLNSTLTHLNLVFNQICDNGYVSIIQASKLNPGLTYLNLGNNQIEGFAKETITDLSNNFNLRQLDLGENQIKDEGCIAIAKALKSNFILTYLNFGSNQARNRGSIAIAEALKSNHALTHLDLGDNQIEDEGCIAIAEALKLNSALTHLDLGFNRISVSGYIALAKLLRLHQTLAYLNLGFNDKSDLESISAIAQALTENSGLLEFDFSGNHVREAGGKLIVQALQSNFTLKSFDLGYNQLHSTIQNTIRELLLRNNTIQRAEVDQQPSDSEKSSEIKPSQSVIEIGTNTVQVFKNNYHNEVETILKIEKLLKTIKDSATEDAEKLIAEMERQELSITDIEGKTALHFAAVHNNAVVAKLLLAKNPNLRDIQDKYHQTSLTLAKIHKSDQVIQLLNNFTGKGLEECKRESYWYEYSKEGLSKILTLRLENIHITGVKVIDPILWDGSALKAKECSNKITCSLRSNERVLVPINFYGKHWIGVTVDKNNNSINLNYVDSEQKKIPFLLKEALITLLTTEYPNHCISIIDQKVEKQKYNNCGPEVIENFMQHIVGYRLSQEEALLIHSLLFENDINILIGEESTIHYYMAQ